MIVSEIRLFATDPLSVAAGILAVLGVGGKAAKGLKKTLDPREALDALFVLINDVRCVLKHVRELLQQCSETEIEPPRGLFALE